jgi:hypothetical protein
MKKCKITVLKRNFDEELAREYGVEGLTACPMLKEGQDEQGRLQSTNILR